MRSRGWGRGREGHEPDLGARRHGRGTGIWTLRLRSAAALKGPVAHGIHRKLHSRVGPHAGGQLNYTLPYSSNDLAYYFGQNRREVLAGTKQGYIVMSRFPIRVCPTA